MIDYSFLRLNKSIQEAMNIGDSPVSTHRYVYQVHLKPSESYQQITNTYFGVSGGDSFVIDLVNPCDKVLENIFINSVFDFVDRNGIPQIDFSFLIRGDYSFNKVLLRFSNPTTGDVYYSSPFICTERDICNTSLFTYRSYGYFKGISYDVRNESFQQIRLNWYFDRPESQTEVDEYYQISSGNTISSRALYKQVEHYKCEYINRFTYERTNIMLVHEVVYVDGVRITNKPQASSEDRLGNSNLFNSNLIMNKDYNDTMEYFINFPQYPSLISLIPIGHYTYNTVSNEIEITFVRDVILNGLVVSMYDYNTDELIENISTFTLSGNVISGVISTNFTYGAYYFIVQPNTILDAETQLPFSGILTNEEWKFTYGTSDYSDVDYNDDYLI